MIRGGDQVEGQPTPERISTLSVRKNARFGPPRDLHRSELQNNLSSGRPWAHSRDAYGQWTEVLSRVVYIRVRELSWSLSYLATIPAIRKRNRMTLSGTWEAPKSSEPSNFLCPTRQLGHKPIGSSNLSLSFSLLVPATYTAPILSIPSSR
jgi:hypothetical protein